MKRCPQCRRDYYDDTLLYCLDDGNALLDGPASVDEPATAILSEPPAVAQPTDESELKTAILQPPATGGSDPSVAEPRGQRNKPLAIFGIAVLLLIGGFFGYRYFSPTKQIDSIAVMPFVNESGNADVEYLSDGMTETLISSLSRLPNLSVKARSTVFYYKGKETSPKKIGEDLNVQAVLLGRFVQRGDELKLSLELVNTQTQDVIWTDQYTRKQADLISLQSEIARDVSTNLKTKLSGAEQNQITKNYTTRAEAYQSYLKGRYYWNKRTPAAIKQAIEYFNQAIEADPSYALAYSGLADCYNLRGLRETDPKDAFPKAKATAIKALEIDPTLAEAHNSLAFVMHRFEWDFAGAEKEFKRALELNPNYATAHQWYAFYFASVGKYAEAIEEIERAQALDPLSLEINADVGYVLSYARRYDEAVAQLQKTVVLDANFAYSHHLLARVYRQKESFSEAIADANEVRRLDPEGPFILAILCNIYAASGRRSEAQQLLAELKELSKQRYVSSGVLAWAYLGLGDKDKAFELLNKSYDERAPGLVLIKADPMWDALRSDPRFADLVQRIGLP